MIQYGRQALSDEDKAAVLRVLDSDFLTTGPILETFEAALARTAGTTEAVAVSSGTAALHTAYNAIDLRDGAEVITTPMTFVATASTALQTPAQDVTVLFADILPDMPNIDPDAVAALITNKTRAITSVDYAGHPVDYHRLQAEAAKAGAFYISDAAHSIGSTYHGQPVGSLADLTTFSFFPTKNMTSAEGGAVVSNAPALMESARDFRTIGMVRDPARLRRPNEGGWHQEVKRFGLNLRMSEFHAALGASQVERLMTFKATRTALVARYNELLSGIDGITPPGQREYVDPMWHLYAIRVLDGRRKDVYEQLRNAGIGVQVNYIPVYWHPAFEDLGYKRGMCPNAEAFYREQLSLPLHVGITRGQQDFIVETLADIMR